METPSLKKSKDAVIRQIDPTYKDWDDFFNNYYLENPMWYDLDSIIEKMMAHYGRELAEFASK